MNMNRVTSAVSPAISKTADGRRKHKPTNQQTVDNGEDDVGEYYEKPKRRTAFPMAQGSESNNCSCASAPFEFSIIGLLLFPSFHRHKRQQLQREYPQQT